MPLTDSANDFSDVSALHQSVVKDEHILKTLATMPEHEWVGVYPDAFWVDMHRRLWINKKAKFVQPYPPKHPLAQRGAADGLPGEVTRVMRLGQRIVVDDSTFKGIYEPRTVTTLDVLTSMPCVFRSEVG